MPLPPPWLSYKTKDGKEYYYNPESKVTTWTKPSSKTPSKHKASAESTNPVLATGGAGRGGLLAEIQQGAKLNKVKTVEKTLFKGPPSGGSTGNGAVKSATPATSGGGSMNSMMAAIKQGGTLKNSSSSVVQRDTSSGIGASSVLNGAGGFAEIMRKNREAAARRSGGGSAPPVQSSNSEPPTPRQTISHASMENGNTRTVETRLAAIEHKLDKIMAHLGIN